MMEIRDKNILILAAESWGTNWLSKHHYARVLAERGNQVFYLGPEATVSVREPCPGVKVLAAPRIPKGVRYLPRTLRKLQHKKTFNQFQTKISGNFDLIWSFDYSRLFDLDTLPSAVSILHMADFTPHLMWREAAQSANLCLGLTLKMVRDLRTQNRNSHFLNHGYAKREPKGAEYRFSTVGPNVVYAGNLAIRFLDQSRLLRLINTYPGVNFHFFGDTGTGNLTHGKGEAPLVRRLREKTNAFVHGSVPPDRLHSIFSAADLLLLCYHPKFGDLVANSHKVMEYLASGTPILANPMAVYSEQSDLIAMFADESRYCAALEQLIQCKDPERARRRRAFALEHTYEKQVEKVEGLLAKQSKKT